MRGYDSWKLASPYERGGAYPEDLANDWVDREIETAADGRGVVTEVCVEDSFDEDGGHSVEYLEVRWGLGSSHSWTECLTLAELEERLAEPLEEDGRLTDADLIRMIDTAIVRVARTR